ncbi:hypothetical protein LCGC14_0319850 [marine sediment metagenome]|uniref:Uncharacterized protein n=1 Tax=marine sediment metagenome TaxID=412755 RepID=A0A0F9U254_9ZZZZ
MQDDPRAIVPYCADCGKELGPNPGTELAQELSAQTIPPPFVECLFDGAIKDRKVLSRGLCIVEDKIDDWSSMPELRFRLAWLTFHRGEHLGAIWLRVSGVDEVLDKAIAECEDWKPQSGNPDHKLEAEILQAAADRIRALKVKT